MKAIPAQVGGLCAKAYTPLPWEIFYEFARLVCVGFIVTFGPGRGTPSGSIGRGEDQSPKVEAGQKVSRLANQCQTATRASMIDFQPVPRNTS